VGKGEIAQETRVVRSIIKQVLSIQEERIAFLVAPLIYPKIPGIDKDSSQLRRVFKFYFVVQIFG